MQSRIDGLLARNRSNALVDIALAAFMTIGLVFAGVSFGSALPKLSSAPRAVPAALSSAVATAAETSPSGA